MSYIFAKLQTAIAIAEEVTQRLILLSSDWYLWIISLSLSLYIYIYIYVCVCVCVHLSLLLALSRLCFFPSLVCFVAAVTCFRLLCGMPSIIIYSWQDRVANLQGVVLHLRAPEHKFTEETRQISLA